jgi:flavorubredoxin
MIVTDPQSGTNLSEIADGIYRINTPLAIAGPAGFSFNQYIVLADEPLLFHTGPRSLFALVRAAVDHVLPAEKLRHIAFSHVEADECGSLNDWLAIAPAAAPLCGSIAAMTSIGDIAARPPRALGDGEAMDLGGKTVIWLDAPHVPHGWECGYLFEERSRTLFCGDLFTQPGPGAEPVTEGDILGPSEAFRHTMDYYAHGPNTNAVLERLAAKAPETLACMHGSAWRRDGGGFLRQLAGALTA